MCVSAHGVTGLKEHFLETAEEEVCGWVLWLISASPPLASWPRPPSAGTGSWLIYNSLNILPPQEQQVPGTSVVCPHERAWPL